MATPHISGATALLLERHPTWTVADVKSALVQTADPIRGSDGVEVPTTREGGGIADLPRADTPLIFASPSDLSFGELQPGASASRIVTIADAGGGPDPWNVSVVVQQGAATFAVAPTVAAPGTIDVKATAGATSGDVTGFVVLTRSSDVRRIPFWLDVSAPKLGREPATPLAKPGIVTGTTVGGRSLVSRYRYPTGGDRTYPGPERVYRLALKTRPANFGVVVLKGHVTPHVTFAGDEDHLVGYTGLPVDLNPYRKSFGDARLIAGAVRPGPAAYDIVFDTTSPSAAGPFTFRFWINDTTPPRLRLLRTTGNDVAVAATDAGSGVDPQSIEATLDGKTVAATWKAGVIHIKIGAGRHALVLRVSDFQETKNMEDVTPVGRGTSVTPNTATLQATVTGKG
jgi:hypothetical protein